jgi:hypothetical protein
MTPREVIEPVSSLRKRSTREPLRFEFRRIFRETLTHSLAHL